MQTLRVNGYDMAYLEIGQGTPLVCVHGTLGDFRTWSAVLGPLSKERRMISLSLRHFFPEHWNGVGDDYLEKVKQTFTRERETQLRNNGFWVGWLSAAYEFGDDPTLVLDPSKMIARMTSANVQAAARRYYDKKQYFESVLLPAGAKADAAPAK